ncbi:hypothetical protein ZHAS_00019030 [Anopheles sinensis]|uniref:Uncharacterized protein n=1 Tax=Anopheles sinensis TaxID=74873 RepID=A0A084WL92_ANOSI|nr:hypothetical protein ZHAS_00019030 [Anopheles sinensis]
MPARSHPPPWCGENMRGRDRQTSGTGTRDLDVLPFFTGFAGVYQRRNGLRLIGNPSFRLFCTDLQMVRCSAGFCGRSKPFPYPALFSKNILVYCKTCGRCIQIGKCVVESCFK